MTEFQIHAIMEAKVCEFCDAQPYSRFAPTHAYRQAAAAARIVGKPDVFDAAKSGDIELVKDHVVADEGCVLKADKTYDCFFLALALPQPLQFGSIFLISVIRGWTALMHSSGRGDLHVTQFLVESGANLEAKNSRY